MNNKMKLIGTASIAFICSMFVVFTIIHMSRVNSKMGEWGKSYKVIEEDVSAFVKVSDPTTIRSYVKQLNDILDDITFLSKIVESGQTSSESLDEFFSEYQDKLDEAYDMIFGVHDELNEIDSKFKEQVYRLTGETDDNLELIQDLEDNIKNRNNRILEKFKIIEADLDTIRVLIKDIENSKINKFW